MNENNLKVIKGEGPPKGMRCIPVYTMSPAKGTDFFDPVNILHYTYMPDSSGEKPVRLKTLKLVN